MSKVHEILEEAGIDRERLQKVLEANDNFGALVHAFETVAALSAVLDTWDKPDEKTPRIEKGTKVVMPSGEVRLITATEFDSNAAGVTTGIRLVFSDRYLRDA